VIFHSVKGRPAPFQMAHHLKKKKGKRERERKKARGLDVVFAGKSTKVIPGGKKGGALEPLFRGVTQGKGSILHNGEKGQKGRGNNTWPCGNVGKYSAGTNVI